MDLPGMEGDCQLCIPYQAMDWASVASCLLLETDMLTSKHHTAGRGYYTRDRSDVQVKQGFKGACISLE
jgi:hypothetical protein